MAIMAANAYNTPFAFLCNNNASMLYFPTNVAPPSNVKPKSASVNAILFHKSHF